ncbi:MAG: PEP-utilizing enzyme [Nitrospiraceae bacterium]|nr:PEP-utilizing enzyme [Nitrospiraceae bacterium]
MRKVFSRIISFLRRSKGPAPEATPFATAFKYFKEVLENNNRALEIIADFGDKLGGEYLFDINYIKSAYSDLAGTVYGSIQDFDLLTQNRYPRLRGAFSRIDEHIKTLIYDVTPSRAEMVLDYKDITWNMFREVGGKNAALAEMKNYLKLNVPDAFAVTTHAFDEFMKHNGLQDEIERLRAGVDDEDEALARLRGSILGGEIPPDLATALESAVERIRETFGRDCFLAVRSSAEEEDGDFSFAGQFDTVLNVPAAGREVGEAYKKVLGSLFSVNAVAYQKMHGYRPGDNKMAAGCLVMVDAAKSGVIYSVAPNGDKDVLVINAAWGLGTSVVEGQTDADMYMVKKDAEPVIVGRRYGKKDSMVVARETGGVEKVEAPEDSGEVSCLPDDEVRALAGLAAHIEKHFRRPQDIEWAIDKSGKIYILQSRPLRVSEAAEKTAVVREGAAGARAVLMQDKGVVVQKGVGGGRVFVARHPGELDKFPKGSVLVAKYDSSNFVRIMPYVSAIITDTGTPTSHMASLCREFRVPTVVNTGEATTLLQHGQEVTLKADDDGAVVYDGIAKELIEQAVGNSMKMEELFEFRKRRYVLRYISILNLVDPLLDDFTPEGCKTMHDILRFIHEKSVGELVDRARYGSDMAKRHMAIRLDLPIPTGIVVVDIGGGLAGGRKSGSAKREDITSVPLSAIIGGMLHPGVWQSHAVSLNANDFLSSMMRMPDITTDGKDYAGYNVAVASGEYVNLSIRFGYHFNMLDCYCSENARNNHVYFRFVGGATDMVKRSRRIELIGTVLREYGFNIVTKGDLIIGRLANISRGDLERLLDKLGRLVAYTRQLDAVLNDDASVEEYAKNFIEGRYTF